MPFWKILNSEGCYNDDEQVGELPFRTKGGIIGYGVGGEPDGSSVHNHQSMDKWKVPTTKLKLLPATPLGLVKVFSQENTPIQKMSLSLF